MGLEPIDVAEIETKIKLIISNLENSTKALHEILKVIEKITLVDLRQ